MTVTAAPMDEEVKVFKGDVSAAAFSSWLNQFSEEDRSLVLQLVRGFRYFGTQDVFLLLDKLFAKLFRAATSRRVGMLSRISSSDATRSQMPHF